MPCLTVAAFAFPEFPATFEVGPWYLRNSRRAIWLRCTSSGPSASRSTRAVA